MLKIKNLLNKLNNIYALQFFQIFRFGILLLISIIFTKINLKIGQIGVYETFLLIAGSVSFFWIGAMLQSLLAIYKNNETFANKEKSPVLFNIALLFTLLSIISAILIFALQPVISGMFSIHGKHIPYMKILFLYIIFSGPANLVEYIYLLLNKPLKIVIYGISTFTLQLAFVTVPVILGYDLGYGLYGLVFINIIRFIWLWILVLKTSEINLSVDFIKEFIRLSTPLILSILLSGSAQYIDGFIISFKFDEATLAIFRYGARELPFFVLLLNAFGNAMTPKFAVKENIQNSLMEIRTETNKLMHWMFPAAIFFMLTSKFLFPIVFNKNFNESAIVFNIYLLILITRFIFTNIILIGIKNTKPILFSSLIELIINITLSLALVQIWGIYGVAFATFISYIIEKYILVKVLSRKFKIKLNDYINTKHLYIYSTILLISFALSLFI